MARIAKLVKTKKVTGINLISTFVRRCVQPLRARAHAMWEYSGVLDSSRTREDKLSNDELESRVRAITSLKLMDPCAEQPPVAPYGESKGLEEVCFFF
jgi:hypothetical protein